MNKGKINVTKVNILGQEYFIKSSAKSVYFKEVSNYVNEKMKEIIDEGIETIIPRIITVPILSRISKLLIAAIGPGVGGIKT